LVWEDGREGSFGSKVAVSQFGKWREVLPKQQNTMEETTMAAYYVNKNAQANGDHEVHVNGCSRMPTDRLSLGDFESCHGAVAEAKKTYPQSNGCYYCCKACHTS